MVFLALLQITRKARTGWGRSNLVDPAEWPKIGLLNRDFGSILSDNVSCSWEKNSKAQSSLNFLQDNLVFRDWLRSGGLSISRDMAAFRILSSLIGPDNQRPLNGVVSNRGFPVWTFLLSFSCPFLVLFCLVRGLI